MMYVCVYIQSKVIYTYFNVARQKIFILSRMGKKKRKKFQVIYRMALWRCQNICFDKITIGDIMSVPGTPSFWYLRIAFSWIERIFSCA